MDEPALRFIGSMMILLFFGPPDDGELQEKICVNFVQNWPIQTRQYHYFVGACLSDYIYITQ
jgi:hypothetical protein